MFRSRFANLNLESVSESQPELGVQTVLGFAELDSTNNWAITNSHNIEAERLPLLVVCDTQTAGRGRTGRQWFADSGTLTFSILDSAVRRGIETRDIPKLALVAGLSVAEAIESCIPPMLARIKWPNDVLVGGKKVAGVLIENATSHAHSHAKQADATSVKNQSRSSHQDQRVVVGVGINVSTDFAAAEEDVKRRAGSLVELANRALSTGDILSAFMQRYSENVETFICDGFKPIAAGVRLRCFLTDQPVRLSFAGRQVTGRCIGVTDEGELELETQEGREAFHSGEIVRVG